MNSPAILVVDDEPWAHQAVRTTLKNLGNYVVMAAQSGEEALKILRRDPPDLILIDLNTVGRLMYGLDGLEACRMIRAASDRPIIVISDRATEHDKVSALDAGADDYLAKPYGTQELLARLRAAIRRNLPKDPVSDVFVSGHLEIDFARRQVTLAGRRSHLTPKEFDVLRLLVTHPSQVVRHRKILQTVWGPEFGDEVEYLRIVIKQLRKKIEPQPSSPQFLLTEPCVGYRFSTPRHEVVSQTPDAVLMNF